MGTEHGKDWRVQIEDAGNPGTFVPVGGEISFDWKRTSAEIDESTKDDGNYGSTSYGQQKITLSMNGNVKLPDAGLELASDVSKTNPPETVVRIVRGATVKFECFVGIGNFSTAHPKDGPVTYSFDMANKGAPDVDDLGA